MRMRIMKMLTLLVLRFFNPLYECLHALAITIETSPFDGWCVTPLAVAPSLTYVD